MEEYTLRTAYPASSVSCPEQPLPAVDAEDLLLARQIAKAIHERTSRAVRDLKVEVSGEQVVLTGWCVCYYAKQMAQHTARLVAPEIKTVDNRIVVLS